MSKTNKTALITGASSGLGMELARLHAQHGDNLVLVARSVNKMEALKAELEKAHGVTVTVIGKDLSQPDAAETLHSEVARMGIEVEYLINNAGFGGRGTFAERPMEQELMMINVDIVALTQLTKLYLPEMMGRAYCIAHHLNYIEDGQKLMIAYMRYEDTFRKVDGKWLFAERILLVDFVENR